MGNHRLAFTNPNCQSEGSCLNPRQRGAPGIFVSLPNRPKQRRYPEKTRAQTLARLPEVEPMQGSTAGGTEVHVAGAGFAYVTQALGVWGGGVLFGPWECCSWFVVSLVLMGKPSLGRGVG